jgi:hypothetical protein
LNDGTIAERGSAAQFPMPVNLSLTQILKLGKQPPSMCTCSARGHGNWTLGQLPRSRPAWDQGNAELIHFAIKHGIIGP